MNIYQDKEPLFTAEQMINDFRLFVIYVWYHLNLPKPTPMQLHIANFLQEGHKRMVLQALRGIGKTWLTGAFVAWRLLRNPNERVMIVSQTGGHSEQIAIFIKQLIHSIEILKHLKARTDQKDATIAFDVNGCNIAVQPSVKAIGITGQLQGNRATLLISDDVEGQQNSATEQMREKLRNATAEYEAILQTDEESQIIVLGTPQSAESIYTGFRQDGYVTRIYPARYPEDISVYQGCLAEYIMEALANDATLTGKPIDNRFTDEDLTHRESRYGRSGFKLQFMLDTTLSDSERYPLKLKDLIVTDLGEASAPDTISYSSDNRNRYEGIENLGFSGDGFYRPASISETYTNYQGIYMGIDPSGRGKDAMGWCVVAHMHGKLFLLDAGGMQGGYDTANLVALSSIAQKYQVNRIYIENNFGDGMFNTLLKPVLNSIYPCTLEEIRATVQKEMRIIDTLEPVMNQHRLIVDTSLVRRDVEKAKSDGISLVYSLFYQMSHITKDRGSLAHDDILDVLAMVVAQWQKVLVQSPEQALERYNQRVQDEFREGMLSRHRAKPKGGMFNSKFRGRFH